MARCPQPLYDAIARGKLIQAIKIYRETTGVGLKEAKDAVDAMAGNRRAVGGRGHVGRPLPVTAARPSLG